jgi:hypothetical protein
LKRAVSTINLKVFGVLLLCVLHLTACTVRDVNDVAGVYQLIRPAGDETISLQPNKTYVTSTKDSSGNALILAQGNWELTRLGGNSSYIYLRPTGSGEEDAKVLAKPIEKWLGDIYLGADEEGGRLYKKIR